MNTTGQIAQCPYCGCVPHLHLGQCPNVKKIEYYPDGTVKSVEKHSSPLRDYIENAGGYGFL